MWPTFAAVAEFTHDVIVRGHGLAGAVLVHHLHESGLSCHVFDRQQPGKASTAAAGVVNPISLRRDIPTWRAHEMLDHAHRAYTRLQQDLGTALWQPIDLIKVFPTPAEADQWNRARAKVGSDQFLADRTTAELAENSIPAPHGYGIVQGCAWLDIRQMVELQRKKLIAAGMLSDQLITEEQIILKNGGVTIGEISARWIIHCNGPFPALKGLVPVKGEVLTVRIPTANIRSIIHRGIFILPIGGDLYRIGSTYQWNDVWSGPSAHGCEYLLERARAILPHRIDVVEHHAGVRPTTKDRRPLLGKLNAHQAVFNGLGSRGAMIAPWCAQHLIEHLFDERPIDPEVDLARFSSL